MRAWQEGPGRPVRRLEINMGAVSGSPIDVLVVAQVFYLVCFHTHTSKSFVFNDVDALFIRRITCATSQTPIGGGKLVTHRTRVTPSGGYRGERAMIKLNQKE